MTFDLYILRTQDFHPDKWTDNPESGEVCFCAAHDITLGTTQRMAQAFNQAELACPLGFWAVVLGARQRLGQGLRVCPA